MPDAQSRWCLFCDLDFRSGARQGPRLVLDDYVDDLIHQSARGEAYRVYEHENRVLRIANARRIALPSGNRGLAMVMTLGDRRGSNPTFVHFTHGGARDPERQDGEVKGRSAHCIIDLQEVEIGSGKHVMLLEDAQSIGRTPVTRLLTKVLKGISEARDERFRHPETGNMNQVRPVAEVWPQQSRQMQEALEQGRLSTVELYDTRPVPAFDEQPEFRVKRRVIRVEVEAEPFEIRAALDRLRRLGRAEGYDNMKLSWRMADGQTASSDMRTDLEDIGTALMARREIVTVGQPMSDASDRLNDEFVEAMAAVFR